MFSDYLQPIADNLAKLGVSNSALNNGTIALVSLVSLWIVWRIWRFTLSAFLWPKDPSMLPYSLPLIGHTFQFIWDPVGTLRRGDRHFEGDGPFAIMVGGFRLVIIRKPEDAQSVWKNSKALSFDSFIETAYSGIGVPKSSYHPLFQKNPAQLYHGSKEDAPAFVKDNPLEKRYVNLQEDWTREQLSPGDRMKGITEIFFTNLNESLQQLPTSPKFVLSSDSSSSTVSLYEWCRYSLVTAGTRAFLGDEILGLDPDIVQHYIDWEKTSWKVIQPHPFPGDMKRATAGMVSTLTNYYALEPSQRPHLSWLFERMQSEQQKLGVKDREAAALGLLMLWAVNVNTFRMLFWCLSHILSNPALTETIRQEISEVPRLPNGAISVPDLEKSPILTAVWLECLRIYNAAAFVRAAELPTTIGDKVIRPGDTILGPFVLMHMSTKIFGPDALTWDHERWIRNKRLATTKGFYPFGGGHTYCPGRVLAKQEAFMFMAIVLEKFEMVPAEKRGKDGGWKVPGISKEPALQTMDPSEDFLLKVTLRQS